MNDVNLNPAQPEDVSTILDVGEQEITPQLHEQVDNLFDALMTESPEADDSFVADSIEASGENEQTDPDDEQPDSVEDEGDAVEESEAEEAEETTDQADVEWNDVDYAELKEGNFRIPVKDSKTGQIEYKTVDQINSEVNKARRQDEARLEVEDARKALESKQSTFEQDQFAFKQQQIATLGAQQMDGLRAKAVELQQQYATLVEAEDASGAMRVQAQLNALGQDYNRVQAQVKEAQDNVDKARNDAAANAATELSKYGLGDLATDPQRVELFKQYAVDNIDPSLHGVINTNASLLAMVEKARLYDKAHSEKPKAKLKGSSKTLKGKASKPTQPKVEKDQIGSTIDRMFS